MTIEYVDIFDADMNPVHPYKMDRKESNRAGHWRCTFDCWVLRRVQDGNRIVVQLRSLDKSSYPGFFDISAAGALQSGETRHDGIRELEEELGIKADPSQLYYLGMTKEATDSQKARNFCHTYFYETTLLPQDYRPQESEVDGVFEMKIVDGLKLFSGETETAEIEGILKTGNVYAPSKKTISKTHMADAHGRCTITPYYLKILVLADLYLKDYRPLVI